MVYRIRPFADHLNRGIDLDYEKRSHDPSTSWITSILRSTTILQENAPILIVSQRPTPLPDAFVPSTDFWCVSAPLRDLMISLFGSQVAFYEVPVVFKADNTPLPSTWFVAFNQFCARIDWQKSRVTSRRPPQAPEIEAITLADVPFAAVFQALPNDLNSIWIEKTVREPGRIFSPPIHAWVTDTAGEALKAAFPDDIILQKHE